VRQGSLKIATDGTLTTKDGNRVLSFEKNNEQENAQTALAVQSNQGGITAQGGATAELEKTQKRYINLRDVPNIAALSISKSGEIFNGEDLVGRLSIVEFAEPKQLRKEGGHLFKNPDPTNRLNQVGRTVVHQGMLETSNVNPAEEMTKLIKSNRLFEQNLKAMRAYDQMMDKEVNEVGSI